LPPAGAGVAGKVTLLFAHDVTQLQHELLVFCKAQLTEAATVALDGVAVALDGVAVALEVELDGAIVVAAAITKVQLFVHTVTFRHVVVNGAAVTVTACTVPLDALFGLVALAALVTIAALVTLASLVALAGTVD